MASYYTLEEKICNVAFLSRCGLLLIQMVSNWVIPDHEADAFVSPPDPELSHGFPDAVVDTLFGGLIRWDAQYFIHIAQYGYTHENTLAFFPLYPLLVRLCANILHLPLQVLFNYHSTIVLAAVALNVYLFVKASKIFYRLSREVLRDEVMAYQSSILFCINPASIFFSAPYSEALFTYCTLSALLRYERGSGWTAPAQFGLAGAARSNGLVNIGFVLYYKLRDCSAYYYHLRRARSSSSSPISLVLIVLLTFNYTLVPLLAASCSVLAPFVLYQAWCYMMYCGDETGSALPPHLESFVRGNFLHSPDLGEAEWCYAALPLAYTHVQDKYWEVGLFRYYEMRQLPNFMLAVPIVLLIICHAALYFVDNPQVLWSLGIPHPDQIALKRSKSEEKDANKVSSTKGNEGSRDKQHSIVPGEAWCSSGICSWRVFVYTVHGLAVCFFCLLFVNVQVTTRLVCSSCPVAYWFAAHLLNSESTPHDAAGPRSKAAAGDRRPEPVKNMDKMFTVDLLTRLPSSFWGQVIISYFLLYYVLGTVLFSNFLPWT